MTNTNTREDEILKTAKYHGRDEAIAVVCGGPNDIEARWDRWSALAQKSGWTKGEAAMGWSALVDAFYNRLAESDI